MIKQFLTDVVWGELDYLIVDTPPGTSDEHISVVESLRSVNPEGAILVTTPQVSGQGPWEVVGLSLLLLPLLSLPLPPSLPPSLLPHGVALSDVRRELTFCRKTKLPILGIIENMSGFVCPHCSVRQSITAIVCCGRLYHCSCCDTKGVLLVLLHRTMLMLPLANQHKLIMHPDHTPGSAWLLHGYTNGDYMITAGVYQCVLYWWWTSFG